MSAQFLIRVDDVCPGMNWSVWERVERIFVTHRVRPILAVVPDNRDQRLNVAPQRADFWDRVREWQARGWTIGWHGYQHVYDSASPGLVGINTRSEFSGVARDVQQQRLRAAHAIFVSQQVRPELWVAPAHSFDRNTLDVLREFGITVVSDGFFVRPVVTVGALWIPQQLWRFRSVPGGVWTVCSHINHWSEAAIARFEQDVAQFSAQLIGVTDVLQMPRRPKSLLDAAFEYGYRRALLFKRARVRQPREIPEDLT